MKATDPMARTTIRNEKIPAWQETWASTYPDHRLSWNKWLCRAIAGWIDSSKKG